RIGTVVMGDEAELAAVDTAPRIHLLEIGRLGLADGGEGRQVPGIGHDVANADLAANGCGITRLLRHCTQGRQRGDGRDEQLNPHRHDHSLAVSTLLHDLSGSNEVMLLTMASVFSPRSFSYTTPEWLTMKVTTPELA